MLTAQRAVILRAVPLDEEVSNKAVDNMGNAMVQLCGLKYKEQLDVLAATLLAFRNSHLAQERNKRAPDPFSVLFEIIDALHQQRSQCNIFNQEGRASAAA